MEYDLGYLIKVDVCYDVCSAVTKSVFHSTSVVPGGEV